MIPFFRKLRKQLANDNKPLKYLRYAIGEIVLVVIGILIALQINNWNQESHQRDKEKKMLIELDRDLASNVKILEREIKMQQKFINEATLTINHLKSKKPFNDSIGLYLNHISWIERIQFTTSAYESLKSVGINLISSDSIRSDITYIFGTEFPQKTMWLRDAGIHIASLVSPYYIKYFERSLSIYSNIIPTNYEGLLKDQEFINGLTMRRGLKMVMFIELEKLLVYLKKTRTSIQKELETF
jgi:hypothetical protein